jgi:hypothetical protein
MTFNAKLALIGIIGIAIIVLCSIAGCGEVTMVDMPADGGAAGSVELRGDGGVAGEMMKLDGSGAAGAGGVGGAAGTGGRGGAAGTPPACVPDACNTCVDGQTKQLADGTRCNTASTQDTCDGVQPFFGQHSCVSAAHVCQAGACIIKTVDCCAVGGACPVGQKHWCSGSAEDPSQPTFCVTSCS